MTRWTPVVYLLRGSRARHVWRVQAGAVDLRAAVAVRKGWPVARITSARPLTVHEIQSGIQDRKTTEGATS